MKRIAIVGSGAGGAMMAAELAGKAEVLLLEAGAPFHSFAWPISLLDALRPTRLIRDERMIQWFFPAMRVTRASNGIPLVWGRCVGGSTTLSCGNAVDCNEDLKQIGLDLNEEFSALKSELPITLEHQHLWHPPTHQLFNACRESGWEVEIVPKMGNYQQCRNCGHCVLGCPHHIKWHAGYMVEKALQKGAKLLPGCEVTDLEIENHHVTGVRVRQGYSRRLWPFDAVILCAGGIGTPRILQALGIETSPRFFIDPVLTLMARLPASWQNRELPMPFISRRDHVILSPYFDPLSFFFHPQWRASKASDIFGIMIKLADDAHGRITRRKIYKDLTPDDHRHLNAAREDIYRLFKLMGIQRSQIVEGLINAGHPGGSLPLTEAEASTLHHGFLPENLYVADASLLPHSLGKPPILTIMALAKRIARQITKIW